MDKLLTAEQLKLFWLFAMPGIIIPYVRSQFLAGRLPKISEGFVAYVVVSIIYHAVLFKVVRPPYASPFDNLVGGILWFMYILGSGPIDVSAAI